MDALTQDKIYTQLYRIWDRAHNTKKIQFIEENESFLENIRALVGVLRTSCTETENTTLKLIYQKAIENIQYMLADFFAIRSEKIIDAAKKNRVIEFSHLFEFEKQYFQQLGPAFKGYSKSMKLMIQDMDPQNESPFSHPSPNTSNLTGSSSQVSKTNTSTQSASLSSEKSSKGFPNSPSPSPLSSSPPLSSQSKQKSSKFPSTKDSPPISSPRVYPSLSSELIPVITDQYVPPFVGADFKTYGPLPKGEIALIPKINANIFCEENMVRIINSNNM